MKYIEISNPGPDSRLVIGQSPTPTPSDDELLVQVTAAGVNRADLLQRRGKYPPPPGASSIPGLELAGEVVQTGGGVQGFKAGDRIYALVSGGAYAEYCTPKAALSHHTPNDWSDVEAAAFPEALTTVYATLFDIGRIKPGQTLLIHGAGSGIASMAIHVALQMKVNVITTAGTPEKVLKAQGMGVQQIFNYNEQDFEALIPKDSIDLVIDFIGADYLNKHLNLLKPQGTLIQIACMKGSSATCDLVTLVRKRLHIHGFVLRSQSQEEKTRLWREAHEVLRDFDTKPIIDSVYPFEQAEHAHLRMKSSAHFGKIVIDLS